MHGIVFVNLYLQQIRTKKVAVDEYRKCNPKTGRERFYILTASARRKAV